MTGEANEASDLPLLLWLRVWHARSALNRVMHLFGVGAEAGGRSERIYQLYALGLMAAWAVLMWAWLLDTVTKGFALAGAEAGVLAVRAALVACALALAWAGLNGLRTSPLKLTHADIAHLAASSVSARAMVLVAAGAQVLAGAALGASVGYLLGAGAEAAGAFGASATAGFAALGAVAAAAVVGTGWLVGVVRLACSGWGVRHAVLGVLVLVAVSGGWGVLAVFVGLSAVAALAVSVAFIAFAALAVVAPRINMTAVIKESALYADLQPFGAFSPLSEQAKADYRRRRKLALRPPRFALPPGEGHRALVARAVLSHARQYNGMFSLVVHGVCVVPLGVLALLGTGGPVLFLFWLQVVALVPQGAREMSRVFRDDMRNRLVRDRLPFGALELLAFDSLPAFILTTMLACVVCALIAPPGVPAFAGVALAVVVNACTLFACGLDAVRLNPRGPHPCYEYGAIAMVLVAFSISLIASWPMIAVGVALVGAVCAWLVRSCPECAR